MMFPQGTRLKRHHIGLLMSGSLLLLISLFLFPQAAAHAQVRLSPPCINNGCDNIDPYGQCVTIDVDGSCANTYTNSITPVPGSCEALGTRLAIHRIADRPTALKEMTTFTGETIASVLLIYSDPCKTNWLEVVLQGRCSVDKSQETPCSIESDLSRTEKKQQDGDAQHVRSLPVNSSVSAHTTMLYAPDVPVQGCVYLYYPAGASTTLSSQVCITQAGW